MWCVDQGFLTQKSQYLISAVSKHTKSQSILCGLTQTKSGAICETAKCVSSMTCSEEAASIQHGWDLPATMLSIKWITYHKVLLFSFIGHLPKHRSPKMSNTLCAASEMGNLIVTDRVSITACISRRNSQTNLSSKSRSVTVTTTRPYPGLEQLIPAI